MTTIEIVAAAFGLISVLLTIRQNIWCWAAGLAQVSLYVAVFTHSRLYSQAGLHVIYIGLLSYGWHSWKYGGEGGTELRVRRLSGHETRVWTLVALAAGAALGAFMRARTDAALPYADAAVTVLSLIAQYLMTRKVLESWMIWITVDVLAICIFLVQHLYPSAVLYSAFLVLATSGLIEWKRSVAQPA